MTDRQEVSRFHGIYGIPEAATLLSITPPFGNGHLVEPAKLRRWIRTSLPHSDTHILPSRQRVITFRDLISMRLIAVLRSRRVSLLAIRETEDWMRRTLRIDWPFVSRPLWTYASDVYTEFEGQLMVASRFGQRAMDFVTEWLRKVELDMTFDDSDLVSSWAPYPDIRIDPKVQLGQACVAGTRIPTNAIWGKIMAGDSHEIAAKLYDLTNSQIQHAIEWEERVAAA